MKEIGGILSYRTEGMNGVHGQALGADGSGSFSVVFYGSPEQADELARNFMRELEKAGHRRVTYIFTTNEKKYGGKSPVSFVGLD